MSPDVPRARLSELVFEVTEEAEGGYSAECLTESIVTQGDSWEDLRANVKDAVEAYFFDGTKPQSIRLHLVRDEVFALE
jgi:predicted RNase H-like HicB family nuclease